MNISSIMDQQETTYYKYKIYSDAETFLSLKQEICITTVILPLPKVLAAIRMQVNKKLHKKLPDVSILYQVSQANIKYFNMSCNDCIIKKVNIVYFPKSFL